jgi:predicted nucleic acid-binding protein
VYYQLARRRGLDAADAFWTEAVSGRFPIRLYQVTTARVRRAAGLKGSFPIAYADAFAMALARELGRSLMTGDREIRAAARDVGIEVDWLGRR